MTRYAIFYLTVGAAILIVRPVGSPPGVALAGYAALVCGLVCGGIAAHRSGYFDDDESYGRTKR